MINSFESSKTTSALIPSFNGNETALTQETETKTIGNIKDFDLPECLKNLSLKDIFEKCNLSDDELEKLKESHANDNLPPMPTDPTQITDFITRVNISVSAELAILKSAPISEEEYLVRFQKIQLQAAYQLLAECLIGEDIRQMKAHRGLKNKGKSCGKTTKKDAIAEKYPRLGARRTRDFQKLFIENVWKAIETAFKRGELPTRTLALSHGISKKARGKVGKNHYDFKKWRAKTEDFEVAFKKLNSTDEIKACSLFCNIGVGTSLLENLLMLKSWSPTKKINVVEKPTADYILTAKPLLAESMNKKF